MAKAASRTPQHRWDVTPAEARQIQEEVRDRVSPKNGPELRRLRHVAGVDVSIRHNTAIAAVPVLRMDDMELVDLAVAELPVTFPYVPGLLTFRECPAILAAVSQLVVEPDLVLMDGQGLAHPRRCGIASHLGVLLGKPTIGCAKTRLIGTYDEPYEEAGCYTDLWHEQPGKPRELIGGVLRTRTGVRPLFISVGHKIDLPTALDLVLECTRGYRLPEPTRKAHQAAAGALSWSPR